MLVKKCYGKDYNAYTSFGIGIRLKIDIRLADGTISSRQTLLVFLIFS